MERASYSFLILIILINSVYFIDWINDDSENPAWDQSWHLMMSLGRYHEISGDPGAIERYEDSFPIFGFANNYYPPFFHIMTIPFYILFGPGHDSAILVNLFFFIVLAISSFFIGKKLKDEKAGIILAALVSTIPLYNMMMREYLIDYSLTAIVALGYLFLLYSEEFFVTRYSVLFAIVSGLGMLTKWTYAVFFIIPLLSIYFKKLSETKVKNMVIALVIAASIASLWYLPRIHGLISQLSVFSGKIESPADMSMFFYINTLITDISLAYFALFMISLYKIEKKYVPILVNILGIMLFFTLFNNKDPRFIMPAYTLVAVLISVKISSLSRQIDMKPIASALVIIILISGFFQPDLSGRGTDISKILSHLEGQGYSICVIAESRDVNDVNIPYFLMEKRLPAGFIIGNGCDPREHDYVIVGTIEDTWRKSSFLSSLDMMVEDMQYFSIVYQEGNTSLYKNLRA